jgi:hypothetical protein
VKLKSENAKKDLAIDYIVGVGKIIPENDIIQISSPVNGIVQGKFLSARTTQ